MTFLPSLTARVNADAESKAFAQAHSVINDAKKKRDATMSDPGFGPVEKKTEDGGQVSDPQQTLRDNPNHDEKSQFAGGSSYEEKLSNASHMSNSQIKKEYEKVSKQSSEH